MNVFAHLKGHTVCRGLPLSILCIDKFLRDNLCQAEFNFILDVI